MKLSRPVVAVAAAVVALASASCGDVPTLPSGVAYISSVISPSLAIAAGDVMRDSLGQPAPLRVDAFDRDGNVIPGIPVQYLVTSLDSGVKIDSAGNVAVSDSLRPVRIVAQALGMLQTPEITLQVVPQPDQLQPKAVNDSIKGDATFGGIVSAPLDVTVSALLRNGSRVGVSSIRVRYEITKVFAPAGSAAQPDTAFALVGDAKRFDPKAPRVAVDTTDGSGLASRRVRVASDAFDSLYVVVTASNLKHESLSGSPFRYTLVRGY